MGLLSTSTVLSSQPYLSIVGAGGIDSYSLDQTIVGNLGTKFGWAVNTDYNANILVVGEPGYTANGTQQGIAHVYINDGNSFVLANSLLPNILPASPNYASFGSNIALTENGNTILIGAPTDRDSNLTYSSGVAYVYANVGSNTWTLTNRLAPNISNTAVEDFGNAMVMNDSANLMFICNEGSFAKVNIFANVANTITLQNEIYANSGNFIDFGRSISTNLNGNIFAVGGPNADNGLITNTGSIEIYSSNGNTWTNDIIIYGSNANNNIGNSVFLNDAGDEILFNNKQGNIYKRTTGNIAIASGNSGVPITSVDDVATDSNLNITSVFHLFGLNQQSNFKILQNNDTANYKITQVYENLGSLSGLQGQSMVISKNSEYIIIGHGGNVSANIAGKIFIYKKNS